MWPIRFADVEETVGRIREKIPITPLESHPALDAATGVHLLLKREDQSPTGSFKARNGLAVLTALTPDERARGVVAASRGNHGLGVAWAGAALGVPVTICVPAGNSATKNAAIRKLGAELVEEGADYDEAVGVMKRLVSKRGLHMVHSTNERWVIAGAATVTLEILDQANDLDALVVAVGGGSQAVGALTVLRERAPHVRVFGVQAAGASAIHDSWHAGLPIEGGRAETFADGLATRMCYEMTFPALQEGLTEFVVCDDAEIATAIRRLHAANGVVAEGAGAAGLAGVFKLRDRLVGGRVACIVSGGNIDAGLLRRVLAGDI